MAGLAFFVSNTVNSSKKETKDVGLTLTYEKPSNGEWLDLKIFKDLYGPNFSSAIVKIEDHWKPGYLTLIFEVMRNLRDQNKIDQIIALGEKKANLESPRDFFNWMGYLAKTEVELPPFYSDFKAFNWAKQDESFARYFENNPKATIRLDEVVFGGVKRDGIPPLKNPKMISADDALYLDDSNYTFGITINGDSRAYPKRILAWHEMFKDTIGGISVCGVY